MQYSWKATQHTECFTCSRFFFSATLDACPRCGSHSVRHYSTADLGLLSRSLEMGPHPAPGAHTLAQHVD